MGNTEVAGDTRPDTATEVLAAARDRRRTADLAEAALTAGLALTNSAAVSPNWTATKLVRPRGARR